MQESESTARAFSTFRVLNEGANLAERDQLFRNMAHLFAYVSERCDDEQVAQYDEVLCQLAGLVEAEARAHVAAVLAPLNRVPGTVVANLANDEFSVAQPLLEFSNVLSDDDLIDIVTNRSEAHRMAIAGRPSVADRVGEAIVEYGGTGSVVRLVRNAGAELGPSTINRLVQRAGSDPAIATDLRGRADIDWGNLGAEIGAAAERVLGPLANRDSKADRASLAAVNAVVYNRLRNRAGFSAREWGLAYNQVRALADRKGLDHRAIGRFARFGYGPHVAAGLCVLLRIAPETVVKWLADQDYVAATVAMRAAGFDQSAFEAAVAVMPWRDLPSPQDLSTLVARFGALGMEEATEIFDLWRAHSFRRNRGQVPADPARSGVVAAH